MYRYKKSTDFVDASTRSRERGFTLIELVIVLAILGVLAAIAVPQLTGLQTEAELSGISSNIASEASNQFAQDLADGSLDDGTEGTSGIDWSNTCTEINSNADSETIPAASSITVGGTTYTIDGDASGDPASFSAPSYNSDGEISSVECGISA